MCLAQYHRWTLKTKCVSCKSGNMHPHFILFWDFDFSGSLLKCYNDGEEKIVKCDENLGYRTCFIRYNESEQIGQIRTTSHNAASFPQIMLFPITLFVPFHFSLFTVFVPFPQKAGSLGEVAPPRTRCCALLLIISFPPAQYTTHLGDADSVLCWKQQPQLLLWQGYYKECETNSYGEGTEKFCYCNFYLCNTAPASSSFYALCFPSLWWLFTTLYTFSATKNQFGEAE